MPKIKNYAIALEQKLKFHVIEKDGCWNFLGRKNNKGYGLLYFKGKLYLAHRFYYKHLVGEIPCGLLCCHHCDNPVCVNPKHIFLGTYKDNMADCKRKNRFKPGQGERHRSAKLTENQVRMIRANYNKNIDFGTPSLAKRFGLSQNSILKVVNRRSWKHI